MQHSTTPLRWSQQLGSCSSKCPPLSSLLQPTKVNQLRLFFTNISQIVISEGGGLQARQEDIDAYNTKQAEAHDNKAYDRKEKE